MNRRSGTTWHRRRLRPANRAAGFTLLEVTIVLLLLLLLAAMLLPRMVGQDAREFQRAADRISDMLMMFAKRESISTSQVGLRYLPDSRRLEVIVYDELRRPGYAVESVWRSDRHIQPVQLPDVAELVSFRADGELHDLSEWPYISPPGQHRPTIEMVVEGPDGPVTFVLPSYSVVARMFRPSDSISGIHQQINLHDVGRSREDW